MAVSTEPRTGTPAAGPSLRGHRLPRFAMAGFAVVSILGLGRALGETLAVTIVLSTVYGISWHLTETGGVTFASNIALKYGEAADTGTGALIASGLCLFVITLAVNFSAQLIINRQRTEA